YLTDDFLASATNTFMVRQPDAVIRSIFPLKEDFSDEELGFDSLEKLWNRVVRLNDRPIVVEGDSFRNEPERVLREYCRKIDLKIQSNMVSWPAVSIASTAADEEGTQARWHRVLDNSRSIIPAPENSS